MRHQALLFAIGLLAASVAAPVGAQPAAKKAPAYLPPRTPDGQPDMQGTYNNVGGEAVSLEAGFDVNTRTGFYEDFFSGLDKRLGRPKTEADRQKAVAAGEYDSRGATVIPFQPWARARKLEYTKIWNDPKGTTNPDDLDPTARCLPSGVPRTHFRAGPHQILQTPGQVVIFDEFNHQYRVIPLDGRPHVGARIRQWNGNPRGKWEGNTLVVETTNFNGKAWLDSAGSFHSDALRLLERFTIVDANTIDYVVTLEDPKVFTKSWELRANFVRAPKGFEALEYACLEGNRSLDNYLVK